eukprot:CAMPEP_0170367076 /NCGR_PEP_ID=MMETSP0117_2-20130122/6748_1 /TAXON_ID=400756 /ORGANISM="Durinskia baltica, Strain CSIRO CS-38" /LENGTH=123 /DNA_ID=CAMNT_0010621687 /DNA_START=295 /DNA_END=662 /DNA_ORIENTATION=+
MSTRSCRNQGSSAEPGHSGSHASSMIVQPGSTGKPPGVSQQASSNGTSPPSASYTSTTILPRTAPGSSDPTILRGPCSVACNRTWCFMTTLLGIPYGRWATVKDAGYSAMKRVKKTTPAECTG